MRGLSSPETISLSDRQRVKVDGVIAQNFLVHSCREISALVKVRQVFEELFERRPFMGIIGWIQKLIFQSEADHVWNDSLLQFAGKVDRVIFDVLARWPGQQRGLMWNLFPLLVEPLHKIGHPTDPC